MVSKDTFGKTSSLVEREALYTTPPCRSKAAFAQDERFLLLINPGHRPGLAGLAVITMEVVDLALRLEHLAVDAHLTGSREGLRS